jgi:hypothetical protein
MIDSPNPLTEAEPTSIDELISRIDSYLALEQIPPPTHPHIVKMVGFLREQREKFLAQDADKPPKGVKKAKPTSVKGIMKELEL